MNFTITLEAFEKRLAIPAVWVDTKIPKLPRSHQSFCLPGENERADGWCPTDFHRIQVPYFKDGKTEEFIRLPFRASGEYPEVEAAFRALRSAYEAKVCEAYGHAPFEQKGTLGISERTRTKIAPQVSAQRLTALFGNNANNPFQEKMAG